MKQKEIKKPKTLWGKFWFLLWKDDSPKGWIFSLLFLFVFIKFIFFPTLSFITGTALPLAIVESCSMNHKGNYFSTLNGWWEENSEKYEEFRIEESHFETFHFKKGFTKGDILFITGVNPEDVEVGDVIIFDASQRNPIIHRVVGITRNKEGYTFETLGDNNPGQLPFEMNILPGEIVGKARLRVIPYAGWVKLFWFELGKVLDDKESTRFEGLC